MTLDSDPPATILRLGPIELEEDTPYTFRPDDYVEQQEQDLQIVLNRGMASGDKTSQTHDWRLWYGFGGSLDQIQVPRISPDGDLWLRRGREYLLLVQSQSNSSILVENAWLHRMQLALPQSPESGANRTVKPPLRYRRVAPGRQTLETAHWFLEVDVPTGVTLLYEEGAGQGSFVHVAYPKGLSKALHGTRGPDATVVEPVATPFLSMGRILDEELFSENYYAYTPNQELQVRADLGESRQILMICRPKVPTGRRPPLILCLCPGS